MRATTVTNTEEFRKEENGAEQSSRLSWRPARQSLGTAFKFVICLVLSMAYSASLLAAAIPVTIVENNGIFELLRDGKPYEIKGAGLENADIEVFVSQGGNSIRTWRTGDDNSTGLELLDDAFEHGVTVMLCIEIGRERHGFDYDDEEAVAKQLEYARGEVMKYKDHPALLAWMIGNEPNLSYKNPKVFDAVNDISKMIHSLDKNHPTTTALSGFTPELAEITETRMSDLDFISVQFYAEIVELPRYLEEFGYTKPYMVTEWGSVGHWEVRKTAWGAPVEQHSSDKADSYMKAYEVAIDTDQQLLLGSYVFLWGQKHERTPTWYGMFLADGSKTETIDVMHKIWTGAWPDNRAPHIESVLLDSKDSSKDVVLTRGKVYTASIDANDPDGDTLEYRWEVKHESKATQDGGDKEEIPAIVEGRIDSPELAAINITAPEDAGAYRLFVYIHDGNGSAAHANIPFLVK